MVAKNNNHGVNALFRLAYVFAFGVPIYTNNLWAIPRILYRFKRGLYALVFISIWVLGTFFAQQVHVQMELLFPEDYSDFALASNTFASQFTHLGSLMILFSMARFSTDSFVRQRKLEVLEKEKLQSELDSLRNQIDPHFLFNALNTIFSLSRHMDPKTPSAVSDLSSILRYVIYDSQTRFMPLENEIAFLRNYLDFMSLRKDSTFQINLDISGDIRGYEIPPLILLPLIENAFKHGINELTQKTSLDIQIGVHNDQLSFQCINSKPTVKVTEQQGIGLENIRKRLRLIYGDRAALSIEDKVDQFQSKITIEL